MRTIDLSGRLLKYVEYSTMMSFKKIILKSKVTNLGTCQIDSKAEFHLHCVLIKNY
jgi:hypothetical protein